MKHSSHLPAPFYTGLRSVLWIALLLSLILAVTAQAQTPAFTASPTSGLAPLQVQFTYQSTGAPTGYAWYFGDEDFSKPWELLLSGVEWTPRYSHTSVVLPDGSIILMGGFVGDCFSNEVWRSTDGGITWSPMTTSVPWLGRELHTSVALSDGSIVLMGGWVGYNVNDIWQLTDFGSTWTQITTDAAWAARAGHTSVVLEDDSIVLMGGSSYGNRLNDVWRSSDGGDNWVEVLPTAPWSARNYHTSVALADDSIVLMGGHDNNGLKNDVWLSKDGGATWDVLTNSAAWSAREGHTSVTLPDGSIIIMGGYNGSLSNDVWRSIDGGITWNEINPNPEWSGRLFHTNAVLTDGSIVLMGGWNGDKKNDVWRLETAGSNEQNPIHIYNQPGSYQVSLQVNDFNHINSIVKPDYIKVLIPIAPTIISPDNTTFTVGTAESFTVEATGLPTPAITFTGQLPDGITLTDNGDGTASLAGTPPSGSGGVYVITITATNYVNPNATQEFTLTVEEGTMAEDFQTFLPLINR